MPKSRLEEHYNKNIRPGLQSKLGIENIMQVPKLAKIVLNVGVKDAVTDSKVLKSVSDVIARVAGQAPVRTVAKKSIAGFKIREGMPLGVMVTLRRNKMYDFLDKLINLALPNVRDFQGLSSKMDGRGNYNLGLKEWTIFPEAERGSLENVYGLNITIHTTAGQDNYALELLKGFGMPFKKTNK
jgi:large subunit ribosomal protein L5